MLTLPSPNWTNVYESLVAWLIGLLLVGLLYNLGGSIVFGGCPKLRLRVGRHAVDPISGAEWLHIQADNIGVPLANIRLWRIPLSRRTRAAADATVVAKIDGRIEILHWGSTAGPSEHSTVHMGRSRDIPIAVRNRHGNDCGWAMDQNTYYVADDVYLTQGPNDGRLAETPLAPGVHRVVVSALYGPKTTERFDLDIPATGAGQASLTHVPWRWWQRHDD